jgi:hypothetical protein
MKIFKAIALTTISAFSPILFTSNLQAQTPTSNNWKDYARIETGFMQGCVGNTQSLTAPQRQTKLSFCQCALNSYKTRYTPQVFMQMNALAVKLGKEGPVLVNVMMKPELDSCSNQTGFRS